MLDTVFPTVEAIGIAAFGISGFLVARRRCLDVYGTVVLALVTALGGGTIRDLVLGITPPVNLL
ncbi:MAG TPA: TRIC cation channel family protein, partial [Spirochaetia bacterium]|nr:TRIC cation channel family protein [Spirochaetia bacterium]